MAQHSLTVHYVESISYEDGNAIARALGRSVSFADLAAIYRDEGRVGVQRLIEHGKRGLQLDELVKRGEVEVGTATGVASRGARPRQQAHRAQAR